MGNFFHRQQYHDLESGLFHTNYKTITMTDTSVQLTAIVIVGYQDDNPIFDIVPLDRNISYCDGV